MVFVLVLLSNSYHHLWQGGWGQVPAPCKLWAEIASYDNHNLPVLVLGVVVLLVLCVTPVAILVQALLHHHLLPARPTPHQRMVKKVSVPPMTRPLTRFFIVAVCVDGSSAHCSHMSFLDVVVATLFPPIPLAILPFLCSIVIVAPRPCCCAC